ncbi:cell division protein ZapA [Erythrobacter alti]|uniref:cell division protein ZapA n=1 Tax=Erythrobacter alti TaxID=1896145 RepID=UPI0030F49A16
MSNVTLEIAGRRYTIACAEGEEPHIEMLGASIHNKLTQLDNLTGQSPERILLYGALLLADELHETKTSAPAAAPQTTGADDDQARRLEELADKLEGMASQLEAAG